jgi:hypothetical protein
MHKEENSPDPSGSFYQSLKYQYVTKSGELKIVSPNEKQH